jgi:hypothetical protein
MFLLLSLIYHSTLLFFRLDEKCVKLDFVNCFLFTQAVHMVCYLPRVIANGFNFHYTGHHLLDVHFMTSLKSNLCTALTDRIQ